MKRFDGASRGKIFFGAMFLGLLLACTTTTPSKCSKKTCDTDKDGYFLKKPGCYAKVYDCNDADPKVYPGAKETCDGKDDNCDGTMIPGETTDADGDGYLACNDCNDNDANVNPGAEEICDGIDDNCDGVMLPDEVTDADGDGYPACMDCDDGNAAVHPGAAEICDGIDDNCDGILLASETTDADGDGYPACMDCNDNDPAINSGAAELCNGIDDNCDGVLLAGEDTDANQNGVLACADPNDNLVAATVRIEPEAFNRNTGKFTAFVSLPAPFDPSLVISCVADGAVAISIHVESGQAICKFNREDITEDPLDTLFEVSGSLSNGLTFFGTNTIKKIIE